MDLRGGLSSVYDSAGAKLLAAVRTVVQGSGGKQGDDFAEQLGIAGSHLSQALNNQGKHFSVAWLPRVLAIDREHLVLSTAAELVSMKLVPKNPLTPEQKLRRVLRHLRDHGANVDEIQRLAYEAEEPDETEAPP